MIIRDGGSQLDVRPSIRSAMALATAFICVHLRSSADPALCREVRDERANPDQRHPAGDAGRGHRAGRGAGAARRARLEPRAGGQHLPRARVPRAARHAIGVRRDRPAARGLPPRGRHLGRAQRRRRRAAHRAHPLRRPDAARAGGQGPDRLARARGSRRRSRSPGACSCTCRRTRTSASRSASRTRPSASTCARRCTRSFPQGETGGFIVRTVAETATEAELNADIEYLVTLWKQIQQSAHHGRARRRCSTRTSRSPTRVLRDLVSEHDRAHHRRFARDLPEARGASRRKLHAQGAAGPRALPGRAAALRPLRGRGRDREGARAPRGPEERRLRDHRPDRGAHHDRREHRRLRLRALVRRHDLQDQPRGDAGDRAPAAAAQPRAASSSSTSSTWTSQEHRDAVLRGVPQGALARTARASP